MIEEISGRKGYRLNFLSPEIQWPLFVNAKEDELLSSWLYRNAVNHYYKPHTFSHLNWPGVPIWNRDIDRSFNEQLLVSLAAKTGTYYDRVCQTVLPSFIPYLTLEHKIKGNTKWIMPAGVYHRTRQSNGLMICPSCFSSSEGIYFKKQWRLSFITCCNRCEIRLLDRCPCCNVGINFFRSGIDSRIDTFTNQMHICHNCFFDLRKSKVTRVSERLLRYQKYLLDTLYSGYNDQTIYSHLYFSALGSIILMFMSKERRVMPFRNYIASKYGLDTRKFSQPVYDYLYVEERYRIMEIVALLMFNWPTTFIQECDQAGIYSAGMLKDKLDHPFWYLRIVRENFLMPNFKVKGF